ncbi:hypothetical protein [Sulfitobacter pontiacus]|nr:hypothetical protein [Sulfitobacter pontiacus]HJO50337.1 hypothetical protein [Sulfitobacter pontiacus]
MALALACAGDGRNISRKPALQKPTRPMRNGGAAPVRRSKTGTITPTLR